MVLKLVKGGRGALGGDLVGKGGWGVKFFCPHPNELLIWAYTENLVEIGLLVEAVDTFCGHGHGDGDGGRAHIVII